MSTLQATNLKHGSSASNNLVLDANGNVTAAGTVAMATPFAMRNKIINGAMTLDQRNGGASVTPTADVTYTLDRWCIRNFGASGRFSVQQTTSVVPSGFSHAVALTVTTADATNANAYALEQRIEGFNTSDLGLGSTTSNSIAISFWVRSSVTGTYCVALRNNAATYSYVAEYTISAANTWEKKTITLPTTNLGTWEVTNSIGIILDFTLGSNTGRETTAGAWQSGSFISTANQTEWIATNGATFYLTGVQLEVGSVATPFERRLYSQELAMCQRYFTSLTSQLVYSYVAGSAYITINNIALPVTMRASPTAAYSSVSTNLVSAGPSTNTVTSTSLRVSITSSGAGYSYADYTVALSAEL